MFRATVLSVIFATVAATKILPGDEKVRAITPELLKGKNYFWVLRIN